VRQAHDVAGEPVAADVRALPCRVLLELLVQRVEERTSVAGAAGIVLAVGAGEEERLGDVRSRIPGIECSEVVVVGDLQLPEPLVSISRIPEVDG
jgi:hypothetical protein